MSYFEDQSYPDPSRQSDEMSRYAAGCDTNQLSTQAGVPRDTAQAASHYERISLRANGWLSHS